MRTAGGPPVLPGGTPRCMCSRCWPMLARPRWTRWTWISGCFDVLPTVVLDGRTRSQHSITLKGLTVALGFGELRHVVNLAAEYAAPL